MGLGIPIVGINSISKLFSLCSDFKGKEKGLLVTCDTFRNLVFASIYTDKKRFNINEDVKILPISTIRPCAFDLRVTVPVRCPRAIFENKVGGKTL